MTRRFLLAALLSAALALLIPAPALSAPADVYRGATKVKDLTLALTSTDEPESGATVSFAGSGPASLAGVTVILRRQVVSDGEWVVVSKTPMSADGSFEVAGVATGVGANKWQVQAIEKVGSGKKATKTKHLSPLVSTTVFAWFYLADQNSVDSMGMFEDSAIVGGAGYPKSLLSGENYGRNGDNAWADFNLSYRCKTVAASIGIDDSSETGFRARFYMALDGAETSLGQFGLGSAKSISVDSASRLRVRLEVRPGDGVPGTGLQGNGVFGDARALCSGRP